MDENDPRLNTRMMTKIIEGELDSGGKMVVYRSDESDDALRPAVFLRMRGLEWDYGATKRCAIISAMED